VKPSEPASQEGAALYVRPSTLSNHALEHSPHCLSFEIRNQQVTVRKRPSRGSTDRWQDRDPAFASESRRYQEPIPSRELILAELRDADRPLSVHGLAQRLRLRKDELIRARGRLWR
jgi:hypothetical protein